MKFVTNSNWGIRCPSDLSYSLYAVTNGYVGEASTNRIQCDKALKGQTCCNQILVTNHYAMDQFL